MNINPLFYGIPALTIASYMIDETRSELYGEINKVRSDINQSHHQTIVTNRFRDEYRDNFNRSNYQ